MWIGIWSYGRRYVNVREVQSLRNGFLAPDGWLVRRSNLWASKTQVASECYGYVGFGVLFALNFHLGSSMLECLTSHQKVTSCTYMHVTFAHHLSLGNSMVRVSYWSSESYRSLGSETVWGIELDNHRAKSEIKNLFFRSLALALGNIIVKNFIVPHLLIIYTGLCGLI